MESENESNRIEKYLDPSQSIYNAPWNRFRFPSGTVIRLLPDYISGNKIAFFIPADEAMGEIPGVKIREDDNPILMVMEL